MAATEDAGSRRPARPSDIVLLLKGAPRGRLRAAELVPLLPAAAIPFLFLHRRYQPLHVSVGPLDVFASDLAVAAVVAAALHAGWRAGWTPLRPARALWLVAAAFLALLVVSCFWTPLDHAKTHL